MMIDDITDQAWKLYANEINLTAMEAENKELCGRLMNTHRFAVIKVGVAINNLIKSICLSFGVGRGE